jgi:ABC-type glycerol-3-phosphate transport system substrate-binding protein
VHDEFVTVFQDVMTGDRDAQGALDELVNLWNEELPDCN